MERLCSVHVPHAQDSSLLHYREKTGHNDDIHAQCLAHPFRFLLDIGRELFLPNFSSNSFFQSVRD